MAYDAFMSYSHAADGQLAPALQSSLQRFAKPWWKLSAVRIFRDETSLAAAYDLTDEIKKALDAANFLILLASPQAAKSKWVEREVRLWLASKAPKTILIVLTEGTIIWDDAGNFDWQRTNALPPALAGAFRAEPLWVDLSWARTTEHLSARDPRFQQATAMLAAPLHGKSLDEIAGEEVRQHRKTRRLIQTVVSVIVLLAAAAVTGAWLAHQGRLRAERNLEQALVAVNSIETAVAVDLQDLAGVPTALRLKMLTGVEHVLSSLETGGEAAAVLNSRGVMLSEFAATYGALGSYADAIARVGAAIKIQLDQVNSHRDDATTRVALAKSYKVHGELLWWQRTDLLTAIKELQNSVNSYAELIESSPGNHDADNWRLFELRAFISIGDIYYDSSIHQSVACSEHSACLALAQGDFEHARDLGLALQGRDDDGFQFKNGLLSARERLAKIDEARGDLASAKTTYVELLQEYERIRNADRENSKWQENLIAYYSHVGHVEENSGRTDLALENYQKELELARQLHQSDLGRLDWSRELSSSLVDIAQANEALGKIGPAEMEYCESLEIKKYLIEKQPANAGLKMERNQIQTALGRIGTKSPVCIAMSDK
jgi:tetratricopeptide (TPR) repeat protein